MDRVSAFLPHAVLAGAVALCFRAAPTLGFVDYDDPVAVLDPVLRGGLSAESVRFAFTASPANLCIPSPFSPTPSTSSFSVTGRGTSPRQRSHPPRSSLLLFAWLRRHTREAALFLRGGPALRDPSLRVESVVWASERKDVLSVLFYLLTIVCYSEWTRSPGRWRWYGLALASAGLGILSKPSLMTLPGILLLVDVWPLGRLGWQDRTNPALLRRIALEKVPFLLLALAAAAVAWLTWSGRQILVEAADLTWIERIAFPGSPTSPTWPDLRPDPSRPVSVLPPRCVALDSRHRRACDVRLTVVALFRFRSSPWLAAGWLWFVWVILPGSGLVTISDHFAPDRYTYLAHAGLFAALVWKVVVSVSVSTFREGGWVVLACLAIPLVSSRIVNPRLEKRRNAVDAHSRRQGSNFLALNQLGLVLVKNGRIDEGIRLLEEAVVLKPEIPVAAANLALPWLRQTAWTIPTVAIKKPGRALPVVTGSATT